MTKKDLKNGMVVETRDGERYLVLAEYDKFVGLDCFMDYKSHEDNLEYVLSSLSVDKVYKPLANGLKQMLKHPGTAIWERPKLYNGKVVCVDNVGNERNYTIGKIYEFKDGLLTTNCGHKLPLNNPVQSFEEWSKFTCSKFIEVVE